MTYKTGERAADPKTASVQVMAIQPGEWFRGAADDTAVGVTKDGMTLLVRAQTGRGMPAIATPPRL